MNGIEVYLDAFRNDDGNQLDIQRTGALTSSIKYNPSQFVQVRNRRGGQIETPASRHEYQNKEADNCVKL